MKKPHRSKINTIEKLAVLVADGFADMEERFESIDERFDASDARFQRIENELTEIRRIVERMDTRIAALELAVLGATSAEGGRLRGDSLIERVARLEKLVLNKK